MLERAAVEPGDGAGDRRPVGRRHGKVVEPPAVVHEIRAHDDERPGRDPWPQRPGERLAVTGVEPSDQHGHDRRPGIYHLQPGELDLDGMLADEDRGVGTDQRAARERAERLLIDREEAERRPVGGHGQDCGAAKRGEVARREDERPPPARSRGGKAARRGRAGVLVGGVRDEDGVGAGTRGAARQHLTHRRRQHVRSRGVPAAGEMRLLDARQGSRRVAH